MASIPLKTSLVEFCSIEFENIRAEFEASGDGGSAALARSRAVDQIIRELYKTLITSQIETGDDLCVVALGRYGRRELFPHSDIDLLFVSSRSATQTRSREAIGQFVRSLWDLRLRAAQTCRTMDDCSILHRDNLEFNVAMLDLRYLAGPESLFTELHDDRIPQLLVRDGNTLLAN